MEHESSVEKSFFRENIFLVIVHAAGPESRTTAMAPVPGGVESAAIVSSESIILCVPKINDFSIRFYSP